MDYFLVSRGRRRGGGLRAGAGGRPRTLRITSLRLGLQWCHTSIPASLLQDVHRFCRRRGVGVVLVEAGAVPPAALRLLDECGFRPDRSPVPCARSVLVCEVAAKGRWPSGDRAQRRHAAAVVGPAAPLWGTPSPGPHRAFGPRLGGADWSCA